MAGTLMTRLALLSLLLAGTAAWAQPQLADPTRPPAALAASAPASAARPASAPAPKPPELQALRLGRELPPLALVDDKLVRVGDRVGEASVLAISEDGVLLRVGRGPDQWLRLNPGVRKSSATKEKQ
ncbi:MSHA biogenesis protein MshK [Pelomonas sp. V22]|uniref:MSHA biogenesis protein MshK n=1 Tax=Pelomonas sp. V22 TaxID=2822139 RepID=UPI0024A7C49F|nr:MSHA biogenesis protein MshK [Pelomonas sp. V22]MDI4635086.1 MSHA biogenesis protein MshK [Pelomonas sp. V22]